TVRGNGHGRGRKARGGKGRMDELVAALEAVERGDFSARLRGDDALARAFNRVVARNAALAAECRRVGEVVGREGRIDERASLGHAGVGGGWAEIVGAVNELIG